MSKNIGIPGIMPPKAKEDCKDKKCPFHGNVKIRGRIMKGLVVSKKARNTVIIRQDYLHFIKKYQRYERRNSKTACHLPQCLSYEVNVGDMVKIGESRKISKTKAFVILEKISSSGV